MNSLFIVLTVTPECMFINVELVESVKRADGLSRLVRVVDAFEVVFCVDQNVFDCFVLSKGDNRRLRERCFYVRVVRCESLIHAVHQFG